MKKDPPSVLSRIGGLERGVMWSVTLRSTLIDWLKILLADKMKNICISTVYTVQYTILIQLTTKWTTYRVSHMTCFHRGPGHSIHRDLHRQLHESLRAESQASSSHLVPSLKRVPSFSCCGQVKSSRVTRLCQLCQVKLSRVTRLCRVKSGRVTRLSSHKDVKSSQLFNLLKRQYFLNKQSHLYAKCSQFH